MVYRLISPNQEGELCQILEGTIADDFVKKKNSKSHINNHSGANRGVGSLAKRSDQSSDQILKIHYR